MHTELRFRIFSTDFVPNPFSALFLKLSGTFFLSHSCWLLEGLFSRWITLSTFFCILARFFSCSSAVCPPMASKSNKGISLTVNKRKSLFLETASFLFLAGKWRKKLVVNFVFLHHFFLLLLVWRGKRFVCITPRCGKTEKNGKTRRWREENLSSAHKKVHNERCKMHSGKNGDCFSTNGFSSFLQWCKIFKFHLGVWILLQTFRTK